MFRPVRFSLQKLRIPRFGLAISPESTIPASPMFLAGVLLTSRDCRRYGWRERAAIYPGSFATFESVRTDFDRYILSAYRIGAPINSSNGRSELRDTIPGRDILDTGSLRLDHDFSEKDHVYISYNTSADTNATTQLFLLYRPRTDEK